MAHSGGLAYSLHTTTGNSTYSTVLDAGSKQGLSVNLCSRSVTVTGSLQFPSFGIPRRDGSHLLKGKITSHFR